MSWEDGTSYLDELAPGVYAFVQPEGGWMVNNCGVVTDGSGDALLVDTTSTEKRNLGTDIVRYGNSAGVDLGQRNVGFRGERFLCQSARISPLRIWKKTTAPCSNSVPKIPSVSRPIPSR